MLLYEVQNFDNKSSILFHICLVKFPILVMAMDCNL